MVAFSAVAEHAVGEGPDVEVVVSLLCEPAAFGVAAHAVGLALTIESLPPPTEGAVAEFAVAEAPPTGALGAAVFNLAGRETLGALGKVHDPAAFDLAGQAAGIGFAHAPAAFTLAGQPLGLLTGLAVAPAAFSLGAGPADLRFAHPPAAFTLAGQSLAFAGAGLFGAASFALTGRPVVFDTDLGATLASGEGAVAEFAVAEFPALTRFGLYAGAASFAVTGQALMLRPSLSTAPAAFALAGGPAGVAWAHGAAAFTLAGQALGLRTDLASAPAVFNLAGGAAQIGWAHDPASFIWIGNAATTETAFIAAQASFALTLQPVFVGIRTDPGVFALGVADADLHSGLASAPAAFSLAGQSVDLLNIFKMYPDAAVFTLTGQDAGRAYTLGAETGAFALSGLAAFATALKLDAASFALTGAGSAFDLSLKLATGQFTLLGWNVVDALGPSGDHIFLVEVQAHDGVAVRTFYLATSGFTSLPSDSPPNQFYEPRISDPGNFERSLFSSGETRGRSQVGAGDIVVATGDPGNGETLDDWLGYGWSGREIRIKALPAGASSLAAASTLFVGRLDRLTATRPLDQFSLQIADRLADLDKPLLTTLFAGTTTSTGDSAEGNADLKGQIKQRCYGSPKQVPLQPANPYDLIYLVSDGPLQSVQIYDGGVALTNIGDYPSIAALRAATIAAGSCATCLALGLVRLGGTPARTLTADVVEGATAADRSAAQIARRMLLDFGIPPNEIITGAFDALDLINDAPCSYVVADDRTALAAAQAVLDSIGAWLAPVRDGSLSVGRFETPVASSTGLVFDVEPQSIGQSLDRVDGEIPAYRVTVQYGRVATVQDDNALAGSVTAERRAYLGSEWRSVVAEDLAVKVKHLNAREIVVDTFLDDEADAQIEADRLLALYKLERERYDVALPLSDSWAADLGLTLTLVHPRLGFAAGKPFNVIGRVDDYANERIRFSLWG